MAIAVIDYGSGNLRSAAKALERVAAERGAAQEIIVTADAEVVRRADRLVLPGVGAFGDCSQALGAIPGLREVLGQRVKRDGVPFLGICVGMQVMAGVGHEHGDFLGLDWVHGAVVPLAPMCTSMLSALDGEVPDISQQTAFALQLSLTGTEPTAVVAQSLHGRGEQ